MNVLFEKRFYKDLERLRHQSVVRNQIQQIIEIVKTAAGPSEIPHLRKLSGSGNIFRIRIGDYRLGIIIQEETVTFVRCLSRRDIYRYFP